MRFIRLTSLDGRTRVINPSHIREMETNKIAKDIRKHYTIVWFGESKLTTHFKESTEEIEKLCRGQR